MLTHGARIRMRVKISSVLVLVCSVLLLPACAPQKITVKTSPAFNPDSIRSIAVLPFQTLGTPQQPTSVPVETVTAPEEVRSQFRYPAPGGTDAKEGRITVPDAAAQRITRMVYSALVNRPGINVVPSEQVTRALPTVDPEGLPLKLGQKVKQVGSSLQVDAVLVGLVRLYRERAGTKIAAIPAAVGFEVHLVNPVNGMVLWTGEYYEEQKPMNEDLVGFFERHGTFVTADGLAEYGVHKIMKEFPPGLS